MSSKKNKFSVRLLERGFENPLILPAVELIPAQYTWNTMGGPHSADIDVKTTSKDSRSIWELLEWLRCPIEIFDHNQTCVWWGYVSEIEISVGALTVGVTMDSMSNKVATLFETDTKQKATTTWNQDDGSVSTYGTKELLLTSTTIGQDAAEFLRDEFLNFYKKPIPNMSIEGAKGELSARLNCRGWWSTLSWKYYSAIAGAAVPTTTQIANIISACGQFITGTQINNVSGISVDPFRQGDNDGLFEAESLLEIGSSSGKRLISTVTREREVIIAEEPALDPYKIGIYILEDGSLKNLWGDASYASMCPVGAWAQLKDVIPGSLDFGLLADPTIFFIEEATYDIANERYIPVPRGQNSPFGIGTKISEG